MPSLFDGRSNSPDPSPDCTTRDPRCVVGAVATGHVPADAVRADVGAWANPTALLAGALLVAACAYLAAVYLAGEAQRRDANRLRDYFALRGRIAAVVAGLPSLMLLVALQGPIAPSTHG
jgi:cytochrome d ubiquinol oxidase subunit II